MTQNWSCRKPPCRPWPASRATIIASIALVTLWPNPLTWLVAVMIVGTRQLGLAILMHEAAHGGLHSNKAINDVMKLATSRS